MARCPVCQLEYNAENDSDPCPRCLRTNPAAEASKPVIKVPITTDEDAYVPQDAPSARRSAPGAAPAAARTTSATRRAKVGTSVAAKGKDPTTGSIVAGYTLAERVGDGATSAVYKALTAAGTPPLAVKVLGSAHASDQEALERFNREARLARRIKHPNLVRVHASGQDEASGAHYLVMDLVNGTTLEAMIKEKGRLPWRQALELIFQITQAVALLHRHGCVHRDIKPSNILVADGVAKLTDLGFVKPVSEEPNERDALIMGTPAYMAPEQAVDAREATNTADVYALGATLYHALTGKPPYTGPDTESILKAVRTHEPPSLAEVAPEVPRSIAALVRWAMAKSPGARPADAATLCLAMTRILSNPSNVLTIERDRRRSAGEFRQIWVAVGIAGATLAFLAWWFMGGRG